METRESKERGGEAELVGDRWFTEKRPHQRERATFSEVGISGFSSKAGLVAGVYPGFRSSDRGQTQILSFTDSTNLLPRKNRNGQTTFSVVDWDLIPPSKAGKISFPESPALPQPRNTCLSELIRYLEETDEIK